jgi:3-dehydroquinate synthase
MARKIMRHTIQVTLEKNSYPVSVGSGLLQEPAIFMPHVHGHQVCIVTQKNIADFYLAKVLSAFSEYQCGVIFLPEGEQHKNLTEWGKIMTILLEKGHDRSATLIALGGGMVGDMTGFAAACYQRGVNYIQMPTTLIAQVDAAIGGKTGVNHSLGKNMIGAFYQPQCVVADIDTLQTLPPREFHAGLAEVIKYALIRDIDFLDWLENHIADVLSRKKEALLHMITTCVSHKAALVTADERDHGVRRLLNLGHTFAHAIETLSSYESILHGEAVAMGLCLAAQHSVNLGWLTTTDLERIQSLLLTCHLPCELPLHLTLEQLMTAMKKDKKNQHGKLTLILLKKLGEGVCV